jgi:uncharacterized membrane protein HdeD (DUF308 family)
MVNMVDVLARNAWMLVARGIFAVIFGLVALFWPGITLAALVLLFGVYALMDGIFAIAAAITGADPRSRWWMLVLEGVAGIVAAAITFMWPGITAIALLYLIAAWFIVTGVLEIAAAVRLRREIRGEWLMVLSGIVSVLFGAYVAIFPGLGALAIAWLIGTVSIFFGVLMIGLGWQLRSHLKRTSRTTAHADHADDLPRHDIPHIRAS